MGEYLKNDYNIYFMYHWIFELQTKYECDVYALSITKTFWQTDILLFKTLKHFEHGYYYIFF